MSDLASFELIRDVMVFLITCKNKEDPIKTGCAKVFTKLYIDFSDVQGQLTPYSVVESGRNSISSTLLCMFLLPARMKKIRSKMKALACSQHFSHYKSTEIFPDAQGQLSSQSQVGFGRNSKSSVILLLSLLPARMKTIRSKM